LFCAGLLLGAWDDFTVLQRTILTAMRVGNAALPLRYTNPLASSTTNVSVERAAMLALRAASLNPP
jgi:hypothetical protein